jgi:hypothetical protein
MTLLDGEAPPPPNPWPLRLGVAALLLAVTAAILYPNFRYYRERRQVEQFMDALVAGDYAKAYELWKPTPSYTYQLFLEDWGETQPFGRIRSYEIVDIRPAPGTVGLATGQGPGRVVKVGEEGSGVIASVRINGTGGPVRIWVESKDLSMSFPPY